MSNESVLARVVELAASVAGTDRRPTNAGADTPLAKDGFLLDSLEILDLIMACEQAFGVHFDADQLTPEHLSTAGSLAALVESRLTTRR